MADDVDVLVNTLLVAFGATIMAVVIGFVLAWILTRTNIPGRARLERLMELPYYMTPLVGAMAWGILAAPKTGLLNQAWRVLGGRADLFDIYSPLGIAWVMALFEGTVAFVMISAAMKSMDPSLEESSRVLGAGKMRTALRITLPLVAPGVLSATVFVFAEMLGAFAAAFVLGIPGRFYVVTTAIWEATQSFPPDYGRAAALGLSLFAAMVVTLTIARLIMRRGSYATITGKAFRPRPVDAGSARWLLLAIAWGYIVLAVILPVAALLLTSFQRFATVILSDSIFTLANYQTALSTGTLGQAFVNSLILGLSVATIGVPIIGILTWIIYRSRLQRPHRDRVCRHVPAGRAAADLRTGTAVGLDQHSDPDLRHAVAAGHRLLHRVPAAGLAHLGRRRDADRPQPGGMRPGLRRILDAPDAHRFVAAATAWHRCRLAADLHRLDPRTGRFGFPDGAAIEGDFARHHQRLAVVEFGAFGGDGNDTDGDGVRCGHRAVRRRA